VNRRTFVGLGLTGIGTLVTPANAWALRYYPRPSQKTWAVLYATWCGSARDAAVWISEGMGGIADVFDVREDPDLTAFDHLIVGSAIRMGKAAPQLQQYLDQHRTRLGTKVRGLFTVCGNMQRPVTAETVKSQIANHLAPLCGVKEVPGRVFLGRVTPNLLEPEVREMMKAMGDYDNLKRSECLAFGHDVLARLEPGQAGS
jgi:hypothetical protein